MGLILGDFDGDGFEDVYLGAGGPIPIEHAEEDYYFVNEPTAWPADFLANPDQPLTRAFYEVGALTGSYSNRDMCHGASAILSASGLLDLGIGNGGPAQTDEGQSNIYYEHVGNADGSQPTYLAVNLIDGNDPLPGIGARIDLLRDHGGGVGQRVVRQRAANRGFASQDGGPILMGTAGESALFVGARWPDGRRSGRILWPFGAPDNQVSLEAPAVSVGIEEFVRAGGDLRLELEVENHGGPAVSGPLLIAWLVPGPGDVLQIGGLVPFVADLELQPGERFDFSIQLPGLETGLYALIYSDPATGEFHGESALWHEAPALPIVLPASQPSQLNPRRHHALASRLDLQGVTEAVLETHEWPARQVQKFGPGSSGKFELPTGAELIVQAGRMQLRVDANPPLDVVVEGNEVRVFLGVVSTCCEGNCTQSGHTLRFQLAEGSRLELDGRAIGPRPQKAQALGR